MKAEHYREVKAGMFSERKSLDDMIEYARQVAGSDGVTIAMMTYNTLLELLAESEEKHSQRNNEVG